MSSSSQRPRIAVFYQSIQRYRMPVFSAMGRSERYDFTFFHGENRAGDSTPLASPKMLEEAPFHSVKIRNIWLAGVVLLQHKAVTAALGGEYDGFVFLGDMHYPTTWLAALICRLRGRPVVFWGHGAKRSGHGLNSKLRAFFHRLADAVWTYGGRGRELLAQSGVPAERITAIGNSLDHEAQRKVREDYMNSRGDVPRADGVLKLISVGRLRGRRRLDTLVKAVGLLRDRGMSVTLDIVGDGEESSSLQTQIEVAGLSDIVTLHGPIYDETRLAGLIMEADLFVVPGDIGLAAVHAHTYGTPVITGGDFDFQTPEVEIIEEGVTGAFCDPDDPASVVNAIEGWQAKARDREATRGACFSRVEESWTPAAQLSRMEAGLDALFRQKTRKSPIPAN